MRCATPGTTASPPSSRAETDFGIGEKCGLFGIFGHPEAATMTYLGLHALQHRGQESAGIVTTDGKFLSSHRGMGYVVDVFKEDALASLGGMAAIGHVRYSTSGETHIKNAQPIAVDYARGSLAVAHNGNLVNAAQLRAELEERGSIFQSTMDTEVIVHFIAHSKARKLTERISHALTRLRGAFSLLFLSEDSLIAARDPHGVRPLVLGRMGGAYVFASETCALYLIGAEHVGEVMPGQMIIITRSGLRAQQFAKVEREARCIFELVYFARPDSVVFDRSVHQDRKQMGRILAREHPVDADIVIAIPDSGTSAALGFAEEIGLPFDIGYCRSHYVGRTFIEPQSQIRMFGVKLKLNPVSSTVVGKRVVVVDDSIVRGTTSRKLISMIRQAGAREVHVRISSPPTAHPCFYGIDTPTRQELIASSKSATEICKFIEADSLAYLSIEGLHAATGGNGRLYCDACFSGNYPI